MSKYFPPFGFTHLPPMKSSYCSLMRTGSFDYGAGAKGHSVFFILDMEPSQRTGPGASRGRRLGPAASAHQPERACGIPFGYAQQHKAAD